MKIMHSTQLRRSIFLAEVLQRLMADNTEHLCDLVCTNMCTTLQVLFSQIAMQLKMHKEIALELESDNKKKKVECTLQ